MPEDQKTTRTETASEEPVGEAVPEEAEVEEPQVLDEKEELQDDLLKKLDESQAQVRELQDRFLRAAAEQENFRKRTLRDKEQMRKYAVAPFVEDLLPVIDSLSIGLDSARNHPEAAPVTEGFAMVMTQLQNALQQHGVVEIDPEGEDFDPNLHDGLAHQPSDSVPEGKVLAVTRKGYRLHDRLLRPASVVVSSGPAEQNGDDS